MTDQQWKRALELYEAAAELPATAALALLESSTEESAVVQRVEKMLTGSGSADVPCAPALHPHARFAGCVIGRYEVLDRLGCGSTGEVYVGRDRELGRLVALKIMSEEYATLKSSAQRFVREAQASSALNHPNIVTTHEVVTWNSLPVIVMELVEGQPLRALCGQPLAAEIVNRIGFEIMQALAFAHSKGIVHRDLKPENVIVRPDGYLKVLDFGLARRTFVEKGAGEVSSTAGLPIGTLRYMSPEQCRGEAATAASDVFAAGILLYELTAGQHPFEADSPLDTAHAIAWTEPRPLRERSSEVPPVIADLVTRMLAKNALARPSAAEVVERFAARAPVKRSKRKYGRYVALAAVVSVVLMYGLWSAWNARQHEKGPDSSAADLKIVPVAGLLGQERMPDLSPDGGRVAFEFWSESSPVTHIYVKDFATAKLILLTDDKLRDSQPVFSPDGTKLAFLRHENKQCHIMVVPAVGGIERQVGDIVEQPSLLPQITWDATGTNLIVSDWQDKPELKLALFAIPLETGERRQLTFPQSHEVDCMPAVSPDGGKLGFARIDGHSQGSLWTIPLAGGVSSPGNPRRLTSGRENIHSWSWTPDGRNLLIAFAKAGRVNLWRVPVGGGSPVRVAGVEDQVDHFSIARSGPRAGSRLVYSTPLFARGSVWRFPIPAATGAPRPLIVSGMRDADARYSPDGKNIAFASMRGGPMDLWICAQDGANPRQMTFFDDQSHYTGSPNWSPDGRWIAFDASSKEDPSSIYVLDVLGGQPKRLTKQGSDDNVPSWSRDGRWIYFSSDRGGPRNLWKMPASGGTPVQVTQHGGFESVESPDGQSLYYSKIGKPGIWRLTMAGGDEQTVPGLEAVIDRNWEGSLKGIYFAAAAGDSSVLNFFDFSTQQSNRLRDLPGNAGSVLRGLSVAPDGRSALYLKQEAAQANAMLADDFH